MPYLLALLLTLLGVDCYLYYDITHVPQLVTTHMYTCYTDIECEQEEDAVMRGDIR